jgi:demethylmenaquinone methyltransferase/2-methoxy-6-polyprenyl-1,4-benzoquinol methylase
MFDRIAARYDLLNRLTSLGLDQSWRRAAVEALSPPPRAALLDLATGTADLALAIAARYPSARVWGLDPGLRMLSLGHRKLRRDARAERIRLVGGVAEHLPFAEGSFDGVTMAFGIRNVPDRERALAEVARVTRPGGRLVILELTSPAGRSPLARLARWHIRHVVPGLGALLSGWSEYRYLERSIAAFPAPAAFVETIGSRGWANVRTRPLGFGACTLFVADRRSR